MNKTNIVKGLIMVNGFMGHFLQEGISTGNLLTNVYLKHEFRQYWNDINAKVFDYVTDSSRWARYKQLFEANPNEHNSMEVVNNMFSCVDIQHFGGKVPGMGAIPFQGAVKFSHGFRFPLNTTWKPIKRDTNIKYRYIYDFTVNPKSQKFNNMYSDQIRYTEESFQLFKDASKYAITKRRFSEIEQGENELALFIEMTEEGFSLPSLSHYINCEVENQKMRLDLSKIVKLLNHAGDKVQSAELYYNPASLSLTGLENNSVIEVFELSYEKTA